MRIWIEIVPAADEASYGIELRLGSQDGTPFCSRSMRRLGRAPWVEPEATAVASREELEEASTLVAEGRKGPALVQKVGMHLFESLLGQVCWQKVKAAARQSGTQEVELALVLPLGDTPLHSSVWEAMHDGSTFLAADRDLSVAITRVLQTQRPSEVADPMPEVPAPARVLFVIGTETGDPEIRVGMDVLGLLRGAERGSAGIDAHVLEAATIDDLHQACERFRPHIVHFVSHGRIRSGEGQLQLQGERLERSDWVGAHRLLAALRAADRHLPSVVVLTGCSSAAGGGHIDPLAAKLVEGGIPVALGMAGRISDRVCRLFARRFGIALSQGAPLVKALTEGRRAGLLKQVAAAAEDPAWALPSIYLDAEVPSEHSLVDVGAPSPVVSRVKEYKLRREPVFCGRLGLIREFDKLLEPDEELNNLVAYTDGLVDEKLGKTRLLHEFAARALRRGHVVVRIDDLGEDISLLPRTFGLLAVDMLGAILEARERFALDIDYESSLVKELTRLTGIEPDLRGADTPELRRGRLASFVLDCRDEYERIDGRAIRGPLKASLAEDLTRLAAHTRQEHRETFGPDHRVVAILGGIGNWGETTELLCQSLLDVYGLGTESEPVPVFATGAVADAPELLSRGMVRAESFSDQISYVQLTRFHGEEEALAYQTVLLHPSKEKIGKRQPLPPYVPNLAHEKGDEWASALSDALEGVPGNFRVTLLGAARMLARLEILVEADEEALMERYLEEQAGP